MLEVELAGGFGPPGVAGGDMPDLPVGFDAVGVFADNLYAYGPVDVPSTSSPRATSGRKCKLCAAPPLTAQQLFELIYHAASRPLAATAMVLSPVMLRLIGLFSPMVRELPETAYQFRAPFVVDASKFEAAFGGLAPTPHAQAINQTVEWYRSRVQ